MTNDGSSSLVEVLRGLSRASAIAYSHYEIDSACLNIKERPGIMPWIDPVVADLYRQLTAANIQFDAVAAIPTGGYVWADALASLASRVEGRTVPSLKLLKLYSYEYGVSGGQMPAGSKLLVVDDTIYQGHAARAAINPLEGAGYKIVAFAFPVDIGGTGARGLTGRRFKTFSTFNSAFLKRPEVRTVLFNFPR